MIAPNTVRKLEILTDDGVIVVDSHSKPSAAFALYREIQAIILILTRNPGVTMGIFSILFLPGVFLHEISHFLLAKFLRVRTGKFSIFPQPLPDGRLQLGYVETARSDVLRDSLIGAAPLIVGTLFVAYVAIYHLQMRVLWDVFRNGQFNLFWMGVRALPRVKDFYLWFYLAFAVNSTMMPSESDRHAWLELVVSAPPFMVTEPVIGDASTRNWRLLIWLI